MRGLLPCRRQSHTIPRVFFIPSSAKVSALSLPYMSTCEGTLIHSVSAFLHCNSSFSSCHRSKLLIACPCFVFHHLLFHPSNHSVALFVTSCESTQSCRRIVSDTSLSTLMAADSLALLLVCMSPLSGALKFRAWPSPNHAPYPAYCFPFAPFWCDPSVQTLCIPSSGGSRRLYRSITSVFSCCFLPYCVAFLLASLGIPGSALSSILALLLSHAPIARLALCIEACGTATVPS